MVPTFAWLAWAVIAVGVRPGAAETLAQVQLPPWTISVDSDGSADSDTCTLDLVAVTYQRELRVSLRPSRNPEDPYTCSFFGPVTIVGSSSVDYQQTLVVVEAQRGGDGDHTGPIVQIFSLSDGAIRHRGDIELFDAVYERSRGDITGIVGKILIETTLDGDGPSPHYGSGELMVPVRVDPRVEPLNPVPTIGRAERARILADFAAEKASVLRGLAARPPDPKMDAIERRFINDQESRLRELLAR